MVNFQKHGPVWLYAKDDPEVQKYHDYLKCHLIKEKMPKLERVFGESAELVKECEAMAFSKKLEKFALFTLA